VSRILKQVSAVADGPSQRVASRTSYINVINWQSIVASIVICSTDDGPVDHTERPPSPSEVDNTLRRSTCRGEILSTIAKWRSTPCTLHVAVSSSA